MKTTRYIFVLAMVAVAFAGCQKENDIKGQFRLYAEGYGNGTKVAIDGNASTWVSGDEVLINGETGTVSVSEGAATVNLGSEVEAPFYGVYPADIYSSNSGASYTLTLPASYTYATSDGLQNLQSPMVAYAASGTDMSFKHLTAAIGVQVVNYYGFTIEVDSIVVVSDSYKLNGTVEVTLSDSDPTVTATAAANDAEKKVKMLGGSSLRVFAGDSTVVQIPVLPVGSGNHFTVRTYVHKVDQTAVVKTLEKTQTTGGALARAEIGYARMATPGLFSVSASKKVIISQGNLQYQAFTGTWKFSETQYGFIGNTAGNTTVVSDREGQSEWVDLFGWGTSGWNNGNAKYQPWCADMTSYSSIDYGPKSGETFYSLTGDYANSDWGVYNAISNGGNVAGRWHTPENAEWTYLTNYSRAADNVVNNTSRAKYTYATVGTAHGIIFFPDEFTVPAFTGSSSWGTVNSSSAWTTTIVLEDWYLLEAAGCIFLPAAGSRSATTGTTPLYSNENSWGNYWSSVQNSNSNAYYVRFYSGSGYGQQNASKYQGYSVRLVRDVE